MLKKVMGLLLVVVLLMSVLEGCGAASSRSTASNAVNFSMDSAAAATGATNKQDQGAAMENKASGVTSSAKAPSAKEVPNKGSDTLSLTAGVSSDSNTNVSSINEILEQRKIIRNANVTVEVEDFNISYGKIKTMISNIGVVQETTIKKEKIYVDSKEKLITKGVIVIRIDKNRFDDVMLGIGGLGLLVDESIKSDDVTDQYFDVDSRLKLLRYEESRLDEYLKKITDPDVIFKTESRLTDIRHEIEQLTGTLKKWNSLVALSTITINMNEKGLDSIIPVAKHTSYMGRLTEGFLGSFKGVITFCGELFIVIAQVLPVLVLLAIIGILVFLVYRRFKKKERQPQPNKSKDIQQ